MSVAVQVEPSPGSPPPVEYRWDADTDILLARLDVPDGDTGRSGSIELAGADGAWLILDVVHGRIHGVEVAVWPEVHTRPALAPPSADGSVRALLAFPDAEPGAALLEVETALSAEADEAERVIHFRVGDAREARTVRLGGDLLLDLDPHGRIAGLWMLNVPPFPTS